MTTIIGFIWVFVAVCLIAVVIKFGIDWIADIIWRIANNGD